MELKNKYTKTELISTVKSFYNSTVDLKKALKIFEIEFGYIPEIVEKNKEYVTDEWCRENGYPDFVNAESVRFMKELQESGVTNMLMATPYIMDGLGYDKKTAKELLMIYITDYTKFYNPEELI